MSDDCWLCRYRESRWTPRMLWYRFGRADGQILLVHNCENAAQAGSSDLYLKVKP